MLPSVIAFELKEESLEEYHSKIETYAFAATVVIMIAFFQMMNQIKQVMHNQHLAQSISIVSLALNLVWNFFFFSVHFQFSISGEYFQYLGLPSFWFFMASFSAESRLFILCWKA